MIYQESGNKKEDFRKSNIEYSEKPINYKYKIFCEGCGQAFFRQRFKKNLIRRYRCGKCRREAKSRRNKVKEAVVPHDFFWLKSLT